MTNFSNFKGKAKKLDDVDLPRIGAQIGVGEDELHAFMDVESAGRAFDNQGRPIILFEPHVFYRNLSGTKRDQAVKANLAYPKWGEKPYPKDSYPRLVAAIAIDETAALKSASWGSTQVLGENYKECGYTSPQNMVFALMDDEENHVQATVNFIKTKKIDDDLRNHNWATVAYYYNGAGYTKNHYDTKMATAFAKWQKIKDTLWTPDAPTKAIEAPTVAVTDVPVVTQPETVKPVVQSTVTQKTGLFQIIADLLIFMFTKGKS